MVVLVEATLLRISRPPFPLLALPAAGAGPAMLLRFYLWGVDVYSVRR